MNQSTSELLEQKRWEQDYALRQTESNVKIEEFRRQKWTNPLFVTLIAATIAGGGNLVLAWYTHSEQLKLEGLRIQHNRILEVIKTGDVSKTANNLKFLLEVGLVSDPLLEEKLKRSLKLTPKESLPVLPVQSSYVDLQGNSSADMFLATIDGKSALITCEAVLPNKPRKCSAEWR